MKKYLFLYLLLSAFPCLLYAESGVAVATVYSDINYGGTSASLPVGKYNLTALSSYGVSNDDISSLTVTAGFKLTIYENDEFLGDSVSFTSDASFVGDDWNDRCSSIIISAWGTTGLSGIYKLQNRNSGLYMDINNNSTDNNANVVVYSDEGADLSQFFELIEDQNGVYAIKNLNSGKVLDITDASTENSAVVQQYDDYGSENQRFILYSTGDGYYQLVARHCGKVVEIPSSSTDLGEWLKTWTNNGTYTQQWLLIPYVCSTIRPYTLSLSGEGIVCSAGGAAYLQLYVSKGLTYQLYKDGEAYGTAQLCEQSETATFTVTEAGTYTAYAYEADKPVCEAVAMSGAPVVTEVSAPTITISPSTYALTIYQKRSFTANYDVTWTDTATDAIVAESTATSYKVKYPTVGTYRVTAALAAPNEACTSYVEHHISNPVPELCADEGE